MLAQDETDLDFYGRRAMEEARAATKASCVAAGAAHRHMAVAYSALVREECEGAEPFAHPPDELCPEDDAEAPNGRAERAGEGQGDAHPLG